MRGLSFSCQTVCFVFRHVQTRHVWDKARPLVRGGTGGFAAWPRGLKCKCVMSVRVNWFAYK